jgi:ABC-type branched-subunit amino acid transport system ATPase component
MLRPKLSLLDEPSHGLESKVDEEMHEAYKAIHAGGTSIHRADVELALDVASRGYVRT